MNGFRCGVAADRRRPRFASFAGRLILLAVCALGFLAVGLAPASAGAPTAGTGIPPGFSTPEDAVRHFYEALAANDFDMAMEACAVSEQASGFDFPGWVDRLKMSSPLMSLAPADSDMYRDINYAATLGSLAGQLKVLIYSFFTTAGLDGRAVTPADRAYGESFAETVDAGKLENLKLLRVDPPMRSILESDRNKENFTRQAKLFGAEEMTERIVLYELGNETYMGGFGLFHYASGWKICRLYSNLAGQSATGAVMKVTVQEYLGML